ncbi:MAG: cation diffusion facilitator family transporter [Microscillaceae bacterium]|nr:cation diffusion facilitator family transporter [Microscillaceae bacterium]MDW8460783.1 cation diffusion facilitator family transporter [Cytophagales bacterium]
MPKGKQFSLVLTLCVSFILMLIKFGAYWITHSTAILTDALESIINVVAGMFALYSVRLAAQPRDNSHPYGHGKIEFISAGLEGSMIIAAGLMIIIKAVAGLIWDTSIHSIDWGIYLTLFSAVVNGGLGYYLTRLGKKTYSLTLVANGKHLLSDTYSSLGLISGLLAIWLTNWQWLDNLLALVFAIIIIWTGYQLVRRFVAGIMDEADEQILRQVIDVLQTHRQVAWIDIHNLRIIQYGHHWHIDCHVTLPWYWSLQESHAEIKKIERIIKEKVDNPTEVFIHTDPCLPFSCTICQIKECQHRQQTFQRTITWEVYNLRENQKHLAP